MNGRKIFFITGNELIRPCSIFIENLLYVKTQNQEKSLLVELSQNLVFSSKKREKIKEKTLLHYDYLPELMMTKITAEKIKKDAHGVKKNGLYHEEKTFTSIVLYSDVPQTSMEILPAADFMVYIVKNDSYSSGYLYNSWKSLQEKNINIRTGVIVSGIRYIEEAADYYAKLTEEASSLLGSKPDCDFLGFYFIDVPRLAQAQRYSRPLTRIFPECGFSGMIKNINSRLDELQPLIHVESLFAALCDG